MAATEHELYIVSHGLLDDPFWERVKAGMETAGSLYGVDVTYVAPEEYAAGHASEVRRILDEEDPDGLAVSISDPVALEGPLVRAIRRENVPVVAINVPDQRPESERIPYEYYIGMDELMCGRRLAKATLDRTQDSTQGLVVIHERGHAGLEQRAAGIREVFEGRGLPLDVLECDRDRSLIRDRVAQHRADHPDTDVFFGLGEPGTKPMFEYLQAHDLHDEVTLSVVDGLLSVDVAEKYIREGKITCSVEQDPYLQGFLPVVKLYELLEDQLVGFRTESPRRCRMGPDVVDKYHVDKEIQNQLLREELMSAIDQLSEEEKRSVIEQVNETFEKHQSKAVVGSQLLVQVIPVLL